MALEIFFSHSSWDRDWCEWLSDEASALGVNAYLAEHDPKPGEFLVDKVRSAIDRSTAVVVLLTHNTAASAYVHQEVGYAQAQKKLVIPLVQPEVGEAQLAMLKGLEYIPFDFQNPDVGRKDLAAALQRVATQQRRHERDTAVLLACLALILLAVTHNQ